MTNKRRDELANEYATRVAYEYKDGSTTPTRVSKPFIDHDAWADFVSGYQAGRAEAAELVAALRHTQECLEMWRMYQSPGNIAEAEDTISKVLAKWEAGK